MDLIVSFSFLFFVGAISGWLIEILFRRIFTAKKWINPGFLNGPWLPLYGFGLCLLYLLSNIKIFDNGWNYVLIILIMIVVLTLIELIAGYIFIIGLNIKLWDYSSRWGNFKGLICPLFSLLWGLAGVAYLFLLHPHMLVISNWIVNHISYSFFIGIILGIFIIDNAISFNVATVIRKAAKNSKIIVHYEEFKLSIRNQLKELKKRSSFLLPFKSNITMSELIERYKSYRNKKN